MWRRIFGVFRHFFDALKGITNNDIAEAIECTILFPNNPLKMEQVVRLKDSHWALPKGSSGNSFSRVYAANCNP